jgi:hypothetical protein
MRMQFGTHAHTQELEALRKRSEEIEREQAKAKKVEEEALRIKENKERARLRQVCLSVCAVCVYVRVHIQKSASVLKRKRLRM